MQQIIGLCIFLAFFGSSFAMNCTGRPDGVYEKSCKSFAKCAGGQVTIMECDKGTVFSNNTNRCENATNVPPPCGIFIDCSNKDDGRYPDTDQRCGSFFTCTSHRFFGHTICPGGTVFNAKLQTCDWKDNVEPPCGTKTSSP